MIKDTPKTRGYDSDKHSALPYVDKFYKGLLDILADEEGRSKKRQTEMSIEQAFITKLGYEQYIAYKDAYTAHVNK